MTDAELKRQKHAETARQSRADRNLGLKALQGAKVDEVGHVEMLIAAGYLPASDSENWLEVGKATAELLKRLQIGLLERRQ